MKNYGVLITLFTFIAMAQAQDISRSKQMQYPRVKAAYVEKEQQLKADLGKINISYASVRVMLVGYKFEKRLDVYVSDHSEKSFQLLTSYPFCTLSGGLGPKRKEGDLQVPEGLYHIDRFNPSSSFHLSLGINYPNASDKMLSDKKHPGGDIFIHGNCVSIGCIPITDECIKSVYILCVEAVEKGQQQIPVYIFPCEMNEKNMSILKNNFSGNNIYLSFWENLSQAYQRWNNQHVLLRFSVDAKGNYVLK